MVAFGLVVQSNSLVTDAIAVNCGAIVIAIAGAVQPKLSVTKIECVATLTLLNVLLVCGAAPSKLYV
ncbi:hypothetical protein D3C85_1370540 [compost metagenome]